MGNGFLSALNNMADFDAAEFTFSENMMNANKPFMLASKDEEYVYGL